MSDRPRDNKEWRDAEHELGKAYLRLRALIPGAYNTPTAPTFEQVWETTEKALTILRDKAKAYDEIMEAVNRSMVK